MRIKARLNIIVLLSVLTIAGLYAYIVKITLDIDDELKQIEKIEKFEENISQLGLITEYYLNHGDERYRLSWLKLIDNVEMLSQEIDDFDRYHIVSESIPSIKNAFDLISEIQNEPELYPDPELREALLNRASVRIQSDVRQLMTISSTVSERRLNNIRTLQVDQRLDFLLILIPAILALIVLAYFMRRRIILSLEKLQEGTQAFASGRLDKRIELDGNDELGELARQFNGMAEDLEEMVAREKNLNQRLEQQAKELKESNRELENFASVASHDLKEPLRMIRSFMELLDKKYSSELDENAQKYIQFAVDGSRRMTSLIDDLLEFSRVGRKYTDVEEVDFNKLIEEILNQYKPSIEEKKAVIEVENLPVIRGVPVSLKLLFQNLISNALKYHKKDVETVIEIAAKERDEHWEFSVSDNGIGIEEKYLGQIFELFERLHASDEYPGTGMGLATCRKIVDQHGGEIWAESEPGKGSTFHFTISKKLQS